MQFTVNSALWRQVFAVPSEITDRHIRMCSGVALKCLLLLLRDPDAFGDPKAIADPARTAGFRNFGRAELLAGNRGSFPLLP